MKYNKTKKYMIKREVLMLKCQHVFRNGDVCGYEWVPLGDNEPKKCPKCQHHDWRGSDEE